MHYVALLRGINVGGNKRVEMSRLKSLFEQNFFEDVSTYINSGNVIFASKETNTDKIYSKIEHAIENEFGFAVPVVIRSRVQIESMLKKVPANWQNDSKQRTDVIFLWDEVDAPEVIKEIKVNPDVDTLVYLPGCVVWHFDREHYKQSKMQDFIGTRVYKLMTARNINTVRKLDGLMSKNNSK